MSDNPYAGVAIAIDEQPLGFMALTLRDHFACVALPQAIRALNNPLNDPNDAPLYWNDFTDGGGHSADQRLAAEYAYTMADAMLAARGKS